MANHDHAPASHRSRTLLLSALLLVAVIAATLPWAILAQSQDVTPTAAPTGTNPPAVAMNLATSAQHDSVTLTWTASTDSTVTHYAVLRRNPAVDASQIFHVIETNTGNVTSWTDNSVAASTKYIYRVKSVSPTGVSRWSGYSAVTTQSAPPPTQVPTATATATAVPTQEPTEEPPSADDLKPTGLTVAAADTGLALSWNSPAENTDEITGYEILRKKVPGEDALSTLVADTGSKTTSYTDTTATEEGKTYTYRVRALRGTDKSDDSNEASHTVPEAPTAEELRPTGLTVTAADTGLALSWNAPAKKVDEVTGYAIFRKKTGEDSLTTLVAGTESTDTSYNDTTATEAGKTYTYTVRANRGAVQSQDSNEAEYILPEEETPDPPTTPEPTPDPTPTPQPTPEPTPEAPPQPAQLQVQADAPIYYTNPGPGPITGFSIYDADTQRAVATFSAKATVELDDPAGGSYALRVNYIGGAVMIRTMAMELSGARVHSSTDAHAPFSLFGGDGATLTGSTMLEGDYTIKATAYSETDSTGHVFGTLEVPFTVVEKSDSGDTADDVQDPYQPEEFDCTGAKTVCLRAERRTVPEGDDLNLTVRLSEAHTWDMRVVVKLYYANGSIDTTGFYNVDPDPNLASAERDLKFPAGSTVQTLSVPTTEDEVTNQPRTKHLLAYLIAPYPWDENPSLGLNLRIKDDDVAPSSPRNLTAVSRMDHVELRWEPPAGGNTTHYQVGIDYGAPVGPIGNQKQIWWHNAGDTLFATNYRTAWDTYKHVVRAVNEHGASPHVAINATTYGVPWPPVVKAYAGDGQITVSMDLQDCDVPNQLVTEFQLQWKSGDQEYDASRQMSLTQDAETGATFARLTITGLTNGTEYTVRARTVNEFGRGAWSDQLDFAHTVKATPTG